MSSHEQNHQEGTPKPNHGNTAYTLSYSLARVASPYLRIQAKGLDNLPEEEPYILAFTHHAGYWDIVANGYTVTHHTGRQVNFLAKDVFFENNLVNRFFKAGGVMPVDRDNFQPNQLRAPLKILQQGGIVGLAPEGARINGPQMAKVKHGVGILAALANVQVVPIAAWGENNTDNRKKLATIKPPISVVVGQPIPANGEVFNLAEADYDNMGRNLDLLRAARPINHAIRIGLQQVLDQARTD